MMKFTKNEIYSTIIALVTGAEVPTFEKKDGDTPVMVTVPKEAIIDRMNKDIELASKKSSKSGSRHQRTNNLYRKHSIKCVLRSGI